MYKKILTFEGWKTDKLRVINVNLFVSLIYGILIVFDIIVNFFLSLLFNFIVMGWTGVLYEIAGCLLIRMHYANKSLVIILLSNNIRPWVNRSCVSQLVTPRHSKITISDKSRTIKYFLFCNSHNYIFVVRKFFFFYITLVIYSRVGIEKVFLLFQLSFQRFFLLLLWISLPPPPLAFWLST